LQISDFKFLGFLLVQLIGVAVLLLFLARWPGPWNSQRYLGSALAVVGLVFVLVARYQLGRSFSLTPQARELITHGLYSRIRNPIYVFGTLAVVGMLLVLQTPCLWVLPAILIPVQILRAGREARVLEAKFGDVYRAYRRNTWF
jgi:protein-S-isoprenylcysteine O-methyltransferase Ste14